MIAFEANGFQAQQGGREPSATFAVHGEAIALRREILLDLLDSFYVGMLIIGADGRIQASNRTASIIIDKCDELFITVDRRLKALDCMKNRTLKALTGRVERDEREPGDSLMEHMTFLNPVDGGAVLMRFKLLCDATDNSQEQFPGCAVFLKDTSQVRRYSIEEMSCAFNLTPSESDVVELLINGLNPEKIAEHRRTTTDTVRSQLKTIYRKTNTQSQLELIRLTFHSLLPIDQLPIPVTGIDYGI